MMTYSRLSQGMAGVTRQLEEQRGGPSDEQRQLRAVEAFGTRFHPLTIAEWNEVVARSIATGQQTVVYSVNLHSLYLLGRNQELVAAHASADYIRIDGMAVIGIARLLGAPLGRHHRLTWLDWLHPLLALAEKSGWSVYYLGSKPEVISRGEVVLKKSYPRLRLAMHHGYFETAQGSPDNHQVLGDIKAFKPDILIVGMGMPRQELWVDKNREEISAPVVLTAGACMDYIAGAERTPPRWLGAVGLEWAYRLANNPRRFGKRYLVEPWYVAGQCFRELIRMRLGGRTPTP